MQQFYLQQTVSFYEGEFTFPAELDPALWHPRARKVQILVDFPEEVLWYLVERAKEYGWEYSEYSRCFYK
jgi:hypothetical protein